jgi:hypothetical protein
MQDINRYPKWYILLRQPEFWPYYLSYFPWFFFMVWHIIKLGNKYYMPILNPAIDTLGGFHRASKKHINSLFPREYLPEESFFLPGEDPENCVVQVRERLGYPCFAKPDDQRKGMGVKRIESEDELRGYLQQAPGPVILQAALPEEKEYAVFVWRMPGGSTRISGLAGKKLLRVCADGKRSIGEMLEENMRYRMAEKYIRPQWRQRWDEIPPAGEEILIQPVGNHNKGTRFNDSTHEVTPAMEAFFDNILPDGIHYGRFDLKAPDLASLETGKGLKIIEFNGTIADPVHALDPAYGWWQQQRIFATHQNIQLRIGRALIASGAKAPGLITSLRLAREARRMGMQAAFTFEGHLG